MSVTSIAVNGKVFGREVKSGTARVAEQLVGHIARLRPGLEVEVFVPVPTGERLLDLDWPERVRVRTSRSPLYATSWGRSLWEQVVLPWKVRRRGQADLLLDLSNSAPVLLSPGVPQVVLVHDTSFRRRAWVSRSFAAYLEFVLSHLPATTRLTSVSEASAAEVEAAFPRLAPVRAIPNAAVTPPRNLDPAQRDAPYVLVLGARNPRKNLAGAIDAFRRFRRRHPDDVRLLVAGPSDPIYRQGAAEPSAVQNVHVAGYVSEEEKWRLLAGARLLLLPSFMEGFGLPVLEALSVGTPVVASDLPVFRELYGDAIEYVDPADADDIAGGIERVFSDRERREELTGRGRRVARRYDWERSARAYLDLMEELTAGAGARDRTSTPAGEPAP